MQIIDRRTIATPGPAGDVTPEAEAARDAAIAARSDAETARTQAQAARDQARQWAEGAEAFQDEAVATLLDDESSETRRAGSSLARVAATEVALSAPRVQAPFETLRASTHGGSVRVVGLGSSTMEGYQATSGCGFFERLAFRSGAAAVPRLDSSPELTSRMWVNGGVGGTRSDNFITDEDISAITQIDPDFILVMVGSNDANAGVAVSTYESNMQSACSRLRSAAPRAELILIHQQGRPSVKLTTWRTYGQALARVAAENDRHHYIDIQALADPLGLSSMNTLGMIGSDNLHMTDGGHRWLADTLAAHLGLPQVPELKTLQRVNTTETIGTQDRDIATVTLPAVGYPRRVHVGGTLYCEVQQGTADATIRVHYGTSYQSYRILRSQAQGIPLSLDYILRPGQEETVRAEVITGGTQIRVSETTSFSHMIVSTEAY